jgi:myo-inositol 2-dehydrogenase / D-chiro-inositol 1-dehydrogenase
MTRYGVLVIGAGRIAAVHSLSIARNPRLRLVGFVDPAGGGQLPREWDVACFGDLKSAVSAQRPDAVVIASPTSTHVDYVFQACDYGLPALCEKPVAFSREPIVAAIDKVESVSLPVVVGFHRRFDPFRRELHERVSAGEIGTVEHILQLSRDPVLPARAEIAHQGGIVADMLIHDLDELIWLVSRLPNHVHAQLDRNVDPTLAEFNDFDTVNAQLSWNRGPVAQLSATRRAVHAFEQRLEVFGSAGRLICGDPVISPVVLDAAKETRLARRHAHFWDRYRPAYQAEIDHLADILQSGAQPRCTLRDSLVASDLVDMVNAAAVRGKGVGK